MMANPAEKAPVSKSAKTSTIRARIDPDLKSQAEAILGHLGLNPSEAIRLFYTQIALSEGLPFEVKIPNATTIKAIRDADAGKVTHYKDTGEMFEKLGI